MSSPYWVPDFRKFVLAGRSLRHRGPDGEGVWQQDSDKRVGLFHRRLSIIDLSENAKQPFFNEDRSVIAVVNGEIYNFRDLRRELRSLGHSFVSDNDCEVVVHAYEEWGLESVKQFDGMFAFLLWDSKKHLFLAARDRFGEKPLYWSRLQNGCFVFASEIKAIAQFPTAAVRGNEDAIRRYLAYNVLPGSGEGTFYESVQKVLPATILIVNEEGVSRPISYWKLQSRSIIHGNEDELVDQWRKVFLDAVMSRTVADVEVGASLSGGLDSSSIVSLLGSRHFSTFSVRCDNPHLDEGEFIHAVTHQYKTKHCDVWISPTDVEDELDRFAYHLEEPYHEATALAAYFVYRAAKNHGISVLLDGQGGDELLCGYTEDFWYALDDYWQRSPLEAIKQCGELYEKHSMGFGGDSHSIQCFSIDNLLARFDTRTLESTIRRVVDDAKANQAQLHAAHLNKPVPVPWSDPTWVDAPPAEGSRVLSDVDSECDHRPLQARLVRRLRSWEFTRFLDYVDRTSMAFGVEVRLPFLYEPLVELSLSLPCNLMLNRGYSKYILRLALGDRLPQKVRTRLDKRGFTCSQEYWIHELDKGWLNQRTASARELCRRPPESYLETWRLLSASYVMDCRIAKEHWRA